MPLSANVLPGHLSRRAIIAIRQASPRQVDLHAESRHRQYQLTARATGLGWTATRQVVIDDDLGSAGGPRHHRPGERRLISTVALRQVGIVRGRAVSRRARNCLDGSQVLELAAAGNGRIADEAGLDEPADFNDRLRLGRKGPCSEIERDQIRARMVRGRRNQARRGELACRLPVGVEEDPLTGAIRHAPDASVRHAPDASVLDAITDVVARFQALGSVRGGRRQRRRAGRDLPHRVHLRGVGSQIAWQRPSEDALDHRRTNPVYAGISGYGRRRRG